MALFLEFLAQQWVLVGAILVLFVLLIMHESRRSGPSLSPQQAINLVNGEKGLFVDLRDHYGITQIVADEDSEALPIDSEPSQDVGRPPPAISSKACPSLACVSSSTTAVPSLSTPAQSSSHWRTASNEDSIDLRSNFSIPREVLEEL